MNEREMLEAAARAVGKTLKWAEIASGPAAGEVFCKNWHPRECGSESMELAAALRISVDHNHPADNHPWVCASVDSAEGQSDFMEDVPDESQRADRMRLAILRCAAAQAPKSVGAGGRENGQKTAETRMDTGLRRGRGVARKEQA